MGGKPPFSLNELSAFVVDKLRDRCYTSAKLQTNEVREIQMAQSISVLALISLVIVELLVLISFQGLFLVGRRIG